MKKIIILAVFAFCFTACEKTLEVEAPSFDATLPKLTYRVGEQVKFNFTGNANNISFYSGETGAEYIHRERTIAEGLPQLQFLSFGRFLGQTNTLRLLATTDLQRIDSTAVVNANWIDITDRATLSTGADNTPSGIVSLADLLATGKPVSFAFRFTTSTGSVQPQWTIRSFDVDNVLANGQVYPIMRLSSGSWVRVNVNNPTVSWTVGTTLFINGGGSAVAGNLDYVVSKAVKLNEIAPDKALSIKDLSGNALKDYSHVYNTPGTYKATFLAINQTTDERKTVVKEFEITVTP